MILYIDETENEEMFIVGGVLANSEEHVEIAFKKFKKSINGIHLPSKYKSKVYAEFKASILDRDYNKIKKKMLESIKSIDGCILFSCYIKKNVKFNQVLKESVYITLLSSIVSSIDKEVEVVFDRFGKLDFEERIIQSVQTCNGVREIKAKDSQLVHGLQFADNVCSVLRMEKAGTDLFGYYDIIADKVIEV